MEYHCEGADSSSALCPCVIYGWRGLVVTGVTEQVRSKAWWEEKGLVERKTGKEEKEEEEVRVKWKSADIQTAPPGAFSVPPPDHNSQKLLGPKETPTWKIKNIQVLPCWKHFFNWHQVQNEFLLLLIELSGIHGNKPHWIPRRSRWMYEPQNFVINLKPECVSWKQATLTDLCSFTFRLVFVLEEHLLQVNWLIKNAAGVCWCLQFLTQDASVRKLPIDLDSRHTSKSEPETWFRLGLWGFKGGSGLPPLQQRTGTFTHLVTKISLQRESPVDQINILTKECVQTQPEIDAGPTGY